ncbi:MAG: ABC transporter ATP-binding protein [Saprospiraceae bacterium]|nr:ABC transporter ATP-binding protein [Saprospiraceae bacterium]MBP9209853.1 ABC transporter ATP-binding protein [Saprospiraceae bacterium]
MKAFLKLMRLVALFRYRVALHFVFYILSTFFTILSIPAIIPLLEMLFNEKLQVAEKPVRIGGLSDLVATGKYHFSSWINGMERPEALLWICGGLALIFLFKNLFRYLAIYTMIPVRVGISAYLRQRLFDKWLLLPMAYFSDERKGDLISRMTTDVQEIEYSILSTLEALVKEPLLIVGSLTIMIYTSPQLTLFVAMLMLFTSVVIGGISRSLRKQSGEAQQRMGSLISIQEESLSGLRVIKAFTAEHYVRERFHLVLDAYRRLLIRLHRRRDLSSPLSEFLGVTVVCCLMWYGGKLVFDGQLSGSVFLGFLYAFFNVIEPSKALSSAYFNIQKGLAAVDRINEVLDTEANIADAPGAARIDQFEREIRFEHVSFRYPGQQVDALSNIDLVIKKGTTLALVGASGSGKSSLVDLIARFYDVSSGRICIDGTDIRSLNLANLRSLIGMVSQEAILFNDTVYDNVCFGRRGYAEEQVWKSLRTAHADQFVAELGEGLKASIGDRGMKLSGGQRQRLTIARALLRDPQILILDEATSALDSHSERQIQEAMTEVLRGRTAILIAHRLSTIRHADEIAVLREGRIVERGTHDSLLAAGGDYSRFVSLQSFSSLE